MLSYPVDRKRECADGGDDGCRSVPRTAEDRERDREQREDDAEEQTELLAASDRREHGHHVVLL